MNVTCLKKYVAAAVCGILLCGCQPTACNPQPNPGEKGGLLAIFYQLNNVTTAAPSYQTVIWLEDADGNYVKSAMVSEYLSYGGYNKPEICPTWSQTANWRQVSKSEFDAVTAATPDLGQNTVIIDCKEQNLPPGVYFYCVQTHVIEDYNILYRGKITIGKGDAENIAKVTYMPGKSPGTEHCLSNVKARYCH